MLSRLQYISQGTTIQAQIQHIKQALDHGADWIQVRWKNANAEQKLDLATQVKKLAEPYQAVCIINDDVQLAKNINADGVHLGLNDMDVATARTMLGTEKIIGGTANTLQDVLQRIREGCDYIGLGPFQFTETKEQLSPILGLVGYQEIIDHLKNSDILTPPFFAIGGITLSDIQAIRNTGVYGIAVSGLITKNPSIITQIKAQLS